MGLRMDDRSDRNGVHDLTRIGSQVEKIASSLRIVDSIPTGCETNSEITGARSLTARAHGKKTGQPLSATGVVNLPAVAEAIALHDPDKVDQALAALLPRSVVSACQARWTDTIGEHGWDGELARYDLVTLPPRSDLDEAAVALQAAMAPAEPQAIKGELARLRASTLSRSAEAGDLALTFAAYAEALTEYPADVVIDTCRYWGRNEKWWPALSELRTRMDRKARRRRLLAQAIERGREHYIAALTPPLQETAR